ncbi:uncharacterized protein LTR77_004331 [Saxophila tyrrhenica]|uniref:Kinesin light chain n=1 Tax=Saxophila tyrrhenica TaxID=1690608 RepID=A0AAV9PFD8_9PEZI|nr:hypothetical protein LTR77_004331 [Saxophila tyrrhenica]
MVLRVFAEAWKSARWRRAERLFLRLWDLAKDNCNDSLTQIFRHEIGDIQFHRKFQDEESARGSDIKRRTQAALMIEKIFKAELFELVEEDLMTLCTGTNLVGVYFRQGREDNASALSSRLLEVQTRLLGPKHPQTLMCTLHAVRWGSERALLRENIATQSRVWATATTELGSNHPVTIAAMKHLAGTCSKLELWPDAHDLYSDVIQIQVEVPGQTHPDTLADMSKLVTVYEAQGLAQEAESLSAKVDALSNDVLEMDDLEEGTGQLYLFDQHMESSVEGKCDWETIFSGRWNQNEPPEEAPRSQPSAFYGRSWQDEDQGSNASGSSSSQMSRYGPLDEVDVSPILVYKYKSSVQMTTQRDLAAWFDKEDPHVRVTKKPIPRGSGRVDIKSEDLLLPEERDVNLGAAQSNEPIASVKLPRAAYWSRMLFGSYQDLYIVSPETGGTRSSPYASDDEGERSADTSWPVSPGLSAEWLDEEKSEDGLASESAPGRADEALHGPSATEPLISAGGPVEEVEVTPSSEGDSEEVQMPGPPQRRRAASMPSSGAAARRWEAMKGPPNPDWRAGALNDYPQYLRDSLKRRL